MLLGSSEPQVVVATFYLSLERAREAGHLSRHGVVLFSNLKRSPISAARKVTNVTEQSKRLKKMDINLKVKSHYKTDQNRI